MEEIIIDGVNVAGCYWKCKDGDCAMYYADLSADNNELEFGFNCEDNTDCYFKQLQRLEQENAELKETIQELNKAIQDCNIQRTRLYKALEEIRDMFLNQVAWCGQLTHFEEKIYKIINEVLGNENNSK